MGKAMIYIEETAGVNCKNVFQRYILVGESGKVLDRSKTCKCRKGCAGSDQVDYFESKTVKELPDLENMTIPKCITRRI
jgi:hypothetical protein